MRPNWVLHVAREVDAFVRSLDGSRCDPSRVARFFDELPPAQFDLERWILEDLRGRLLCSNGLFERRTRAEQARQLLVDDYRRPWTLATLARAVGSNRTTLQAEFHALTGTTVHQFLVRRRVSAALYLLEASDVKVSRISREVGYRSHSAFVRHFKRVTGVTLTTYRLSRHALQIAFRNRIPAEREPNVT